jgi:hypothetical protein
MTTTTATTMMMMMKRVALSRADGSVQVGCRGCWGSGWAARVACNGRERACGGSDRRTRGGVGEVGNGKGRDGRAARSSRRGRRDRRVRSEGPRDRVHTADYDYDYAHTGEEGGRGRGRGRVEDRPPLSTSGALWARRKASYAMQQAAAEARRKLSGRCRDALLGWRWPGMAAGWALLLGCWAAGCRAALQSQEQPRRRRLDSRIPARARQRGLVAGLIPLRMHMLAINVGRRRIASSSALWCPSGALCGARSRPRVSSHPPRCSMDSTTLPRRRRST